jgi:multidrug transporter EmrE-like cation transporter
MTFPNFLLILIGVLLNAVAQLFLKAGTTYFGKILTEHRLVSNFFRIIFEPHIFTGLICYAFSVSIWIVALSKVPVSVAYPMLSIGYVVNIFAAYYIFGEALTFNKFYGVFFIILGIILIAKS